MSITSTHIIGTFLALPNLAPSHVEALERLEIPSDALAGPTPMRVTHVHFEGAHFEFEHHHTRDGAEPAYVFLILDQHGDALDIVAWSPATGKVATWLGRAWALGQERINAPRLTDHGGLVVHRSPDGWLKARQEGIFVIQSHAAASRLEDAGPLLAEDFEHLLELRRLLARPGPRVLVAADKLTSSHSEDFENDFVR